MEQLTDLPPLLCFLACADGGTKANRAGFNLPSRHGPKQVQGLLPLLAAGTSTWQGPPLFGVYPSSSTPQKADPWLFPCRRRTSTTLFLSGPLEDQGTGQLQTTVVVETANQANRFKGQLAMGQNPNRLAPSEHPNPTTKSGFQNGW